MRLGQASSRYVSPSYMILSIDVHLSVEKYIPSFSCSVNNILHGDIGRNLLHIFIMGNVVGLFDDIVRSHCVKTVKTNDSGDGMERL